MAEKKKPSNKAMKAKPENKSEAKPKKPAKAKTDWGKLPPIVKIIATNGKHMKAGQEYKVTKETAKILVDKGSAELKK